MPKERRDSSLSHDSSRTSPYPSSSSRVRRSAPKNPLESEENIKEWEDARCPVCMEHPHNAILLICSSHEKGCRPYMCNTSYRHSNCLDQFCKSFTETSPPTPTVEGQISNTNLSHVDTTEANPVDTQEERSEGSVTIHPLSCEDHSKPKLVCPLCRGQIKEWKVVEAARRFMNEKSRSCSCETCNFTGTYTDLRKHARLEHPLVRPSEVDPERQRNWRRLERQRDLGDLLSTLQSSFGENSRVDDGILPIDDGGLLAVFFLILQPSSVSRGTSGTRLQMRIRRRSTRLWGETYEGESGSSSRDDENESSDGGSGTWRRRVRRRITPENQP
ncbi:plant/MPE11-6 protein [Senna tora]|uniref:Plant/MPE11-6 protein n=1 Tax=Senna tora TaxID=362788 RepID=A0A834W247_9FABA|nr:plant/MPE11-6 protein [Senna tora]